MTLAGSPLEAGIEAYQNAYPKISLEAAQDRRPGSRTSARSCTASCPRAASRRSAAPEFYPVSGVLKVFATNEEVARFAGETGKQLGLNVETADRQAELRRPRAQGS